MTDRRVDRQTESDAYKPIMHKHRCAQNGKSYKKNYFIDPNLITEPRFPMFYLFLYNQAQCYR